MFADKLQWGDDAMNIDRRYRLARIWSNQELRKIGPLFRGDVVNVSAGENVDKQGGTYESYFPNSSVFYLTNYTPGSFRGFQDRENEFLVDLTEELPSELAARFDVAFSHTTLEHIFDVGTAFANICRLSKDIVIVVVPFSQAQHESNAYKDYWRFTPTCLRKLFANNGLDVVYETANSDMNAALYLFMVGSRHADEWKGRMPYYEPCGTVGECIGDPRVHYWRSTAIHRLGELGRRLRAIWTG